MDFREEKVELIALQILVFLFVCMYVCEFSVFSLKVLGSAKSGHHTS